MFKAATAASNTLMMLSVNTSTPHAQVVPAAPGGTLWAQFYPVENRATTQQSMDAFQNAGCNGIIVTIDQQASYYERTQQDRNFGGRVAGTGGRGCARRSSPLRCSRARFDDWN